MCASHHNKLLNRQLGTHLTLKQALKVVQYTLVGLKRSPAGQQQLLDGALEPQHGTVEAVLLDGAAEEWQGGAAAHHWVSYE